MQCLPLILDKFLKYFRRRIHRSIILHLVFRTGPFAFSEWIARYPQPPVLLRRSLDDDVLPSGFKIPRGADVFISTWNIHMSPDIWESPETFDPTRFERPVDPVPERSWSGYDPGKVGSSLFPNEMASANAQLAPQQAANRGT